MVDMAFVWLMQKGFHTYTSNFLVDAFFDIYPGQKLQHVVVYLGQEGAVLKFVCIGYLVCAEWFMFPVCYFLVIMIYYCLFVGLAPTMVFSITVERPFD